MPESVTRKRVLLLSRMLTQGGSERQLTLMALNLDRRRYDVRVGVMIDNGIRADDLRAAGIPISVYPIRKLVSPGTLRQGWALKCYIEREKIDLVHSFDVPMNAIGLPFARMSRGAVILSSQRAHRELSDGIYRRLLRFSDRLVAGTVVNCDFVRRHLIEDEGVAPGRIHLCYNGLDLSALAPSRARPAAFGPAETVVGVVCALRPEKGLETLFEGFAHVAAEFPAARLAFVGGGPMREPLTQMARERGLADRVDFTGETKEVARMLAGIDIFVLPSRSEALSNSLMEAMAMGCFAIASRVGGNPELVTDGETGLLFERDRPEDLARALRQALRNPDWRRDLARAGERRMRTEFPVERAAQRMSEIYELFLGNRA
ncbi:MAG: glycosyltransferase [Bryobacteraceae bacterium]|nr:glycosyltransferase [Bryobacteraceae bacterium]